jgi:hypothetical protein
VQEQCLSQTISNNSTLYSYDIEFSQDAVVCLSVQTLGEGGGGGGKKKEGTKTCTKSSWLNFNSTLKKYILVFII